MFQAYSGLGIVQAAEPEIVLAAWNVENLFDPVDDPDNEGDDAYTPEGWVHWSENRYRGKLKHLAEVIAEIDPDIICLSEVENRRVLVDLSSVLASDFNCMIEEISHRDGEDFRGIDVAVMSKHKPTTKIWFNSVSGQRDVIACRFEIYGRELTVIGNHWKSLLGKKARSDAIRTRQAESVRNFIDREIAYNPSAAIVVAGDFNSDIDSPFLVESAGFSVDFDEVDKAQNTARLYNLAAGLDKKERATYYYVRGQRWNSFDSISVTCGMLGMEPKASWQVKPDSYSVYKSPKITFKGLGSPLPYRRVRSKKYGDRFVAGYSDHFAVFVVLEPGDK
ncbi:MAG: endonuclease/exonuclease/phosphatase family protein [Kiritimatiellia bacterium]